jgi:sugar fermentation stimulation protein A
MRFPTRLVRGDLVRRYKRFLADVRLDSGEVVTVHCANPGSMLGLVEPGTTVWLTRSEDPARKLAWSWQLLDLRLHGRPARVGINTGNPNRIVAEAIGAGRVPELAGYRRLRNEVRYGRNSRVDLLLEDDLRPPCYVEIKNVHLLRRPGLAEFPDSVTARGVKHLVELSAMARAGARAVMFFLVQRNDADRLGLARDLDPGYAAAFAAARAAGVEALVYSCKLTRREIRLDRAIPMTEECGAGALPAGSRSE